MGNAPVKRLRASIVVAATAALLIAAPASASHTNDALSDEAGWPCTASSSKAGWTLLASPQDGWSISPLVKQHRAVISSWNVRVGPGLEPLAQQLGVFRAVSGGAEYTKVAESAIETFGEGSEQVPTRIPVQTGDYVGLHGPVGTFVCEKEEVAASALFEGSIGLGETKAFKTQSGVRSPVSAVVEIDVDGDGYGDASQDGCSESALFQDPCPQVTLDIGEAAVKRRAILIEVGNNTEASVEARGEVRWQSGPKKSYRRPNRRVGLGTVAPKTVTTGTTVVLKVPLPESVRQRLDRLSPRKWLLAWITVVGRNQLSHIGRAELRVRLHGRKPPARRR